MIDAICLTTVDIDDLVEKYFLPLVDEEFRNPMKVRVLPPENGSACVGESKWFIAFDVNDLEEYSLSSLFIGRDWQYAHCDIYDFIHALVAEGFLESGTYWVLYEW